jgi:hypothetical protein
LTVNEAHERATGRKYVGSRDIDLGFHFDPRWKPDEFKASPFSKAITKIKALGFEPESVRFVKRYHSSEMRELTPEESRHLPQYDIFNLYIDVLVDSDDPERFKRAGFSVLEEPLLSRLFGGEDHVTIKLEEISVLMPAPQLLMEMKANSLPNRTEDDKKTKDLLDLCALLLYSGHKPPTINKASKGGRLKASYEQAVGNITKGEWKYVADVLDVSASAARRLARLIR